MDALHSSPPPLSDVLREIARIGAPRANRRLERKVRDVIAFHQRWRRRRDGLVVRVVQLHRAESLAEVEALAPVAPGDPWEHSRYAVSFGSLGSEYDLLVALDGGVR